MAVRQAALVSDESALGACLRRFSIQIDDLYLFLTASGAISYFTKPVIYGNHKYTDAGRGGGHGAYNGGLRA